MTIDQYIFNIAQRYKLGNATEHTFRGDLQQLIETIVPEIRATNEPKRQSCGAPDYILTKKDIPVGFIEAKDIGDRDLDGLKKAGNKEQFDRYKASLDNLMFTDYLSFHLYREGEFTSKVTIGEITETGIKALPENFGSFKNLINDFCLHFGQSIKSPKKLAKMMAGKARLLSDIIEKALTSDETNHEDSTLKDQMNAFRQILIHDITPKGFADVYAQTIAYGMFAARLHDPTLDSFSRQEAAELIPKSNPFLRKLFGYIAGPDIDDRIKWVVDSLTDIFLACNVEEILKNYGKATQTEDPIIHFYETFLSEYDPKLRKSRGVWYTPAPVVNFIVRAVDDILKTEFDLPQGLADTSKTTIKVNTDIADKKFKGGYRQVDKEVHKVQILDPATGTGTFLAEVVKHIHKKFEGQQGIWSNYVEKQLLPRLNGFELLMASYAMAHLKLDLLLKETGFNPTSNQRFRVYLTNSLEEHHKETGTLFSSWLSTEANEANTIKRDTPVMCVIGNPPYSGLSANQGKWIKELIEDYKYVDGEHFGERKHWLNDDYVKFIRYGQHFIEKNGSGILALINPHGFLDNPTFRGMRWNLLKAFDKIYTVDLHGNSNKIEKSPDGSPDINVFDIQQGVSINIFIKTGRKKINSLSKVFSTDLYGKRDYKYNFLLNNSLADIPFKKIEPNSPYFFFVKSDSNLFEHYGTGFSVSELINNYTVGCVTANDGLNVSFTKNEHESKIQDLLEMQEVDWRIKYNRKKDSRDWTYQTAKKDATDNNKVNNYTQVSYRPFDMRWTLYTGKSRGLYSSPQPKIMKQFIRRENLGLVTARSNKSETCDHFYISKFMMETKCGERTTQSAIFPLYLYSESNGQQTIESSSARKPNLNTEIVSEIADKLGLTFVPEKFPSSGGVAESRGGQEARRNTENYMKLPYNAKLKERARELRKAGNLSEVLFWNEVKNKQFKGLDFDRQKIIGNYIVDFFCTNCNVVVEIDGSSHDDKVEYDAERDGFLERLGLTVIHIPVVEVMKNMDKTMEMLYHHSAFNKTTPPDGHPSSGGEFAPIDLLDYIYAVLHSPEYREKYKEFLKIDFPRVPYPKNAEKFWQLVKLGGEIRRIHLLESPVVEQYLTQYPVDGDNEVTKPKYVPIPKDEATGILRGNVFINDTQYFANVPLTAWKFYIGGYQPAQKWLKDRKGRTLGFEDILHYQKIIVALSETDRLMKEVDAVGVV